MKALEVLIICSTFMGSIFLSIKVAEWHYKTYKGEQPLFIIYGMIGTMIWGTIMTFIMECICAVGGN
jgi:hypothetical protein